MFQVEKKGREDVSEAFTGFSVEGMGSGKNEEIVLT